MLALNSTLRMTCCYTCRMQSRCKRLRACNRGGGAVPADTLPLQDWMVASVARPPVQESLTVFTAVCELPWQMHGPPHHRYRWGSHFCSTAGTRSSSNSASVFRSPRAAADLHSVCAGRHGTTHAGRRAAGALRGRVDGGGAAAWMATPCDRRWGAAEAAGSQTSATGCATGGTACCGGYSRDALRCTCAGGPHPTMCPPVRRTRNLTTRSLAARRVEYYCPLVTQLGGKNCSIEKNNVGRGRERG